ncbi:MAG: molybdopterin converting factor subunit 1 [Hyphomicrobiales bacterium]|nr:molybdopterin converting factor subunit 1 [Hyphomicrobiales bacterium]NBR10793.1 molybdopterin converting factor subunit 1 [Alphaproteobacteria bacterium]
MKLVYFAWVRERVGVAEEIIDVPENILTVAALAAWLSQRDEGYASAFENPKLVRAAIDRVHAKPQDVIAGAREIAFFPPMTGG